MTTTMIKIAWAFPEERIKELKRLWGYVAPDSSDTVHYFVSCETDLYELVPDILVTNQYDWSLNYCNNRNSLKWVHFMSAGIDKAIGILKNKSFENFIITNVKGIHTECMRNYVMSWILAESQNVLHYYDSQKHKEWSRRRSYSLIGKKMLIFGYGSIGVAIGQLALSFGMTVIGVKNTLTESNNPNEIIIFPHQIATYAKESDYIILAAPLTKETNKFFNKRIFDLFMSGPLLINLSRAEIIETEDLKDAILRGVIRSAVLDVHESEPLLPNSDQWELNKVQITPHVAGFTDNGLNLGIERFIYLLSLFKMSEIPNEERVSIIKGY